MKQIILIIGLLFSFATAKSQLANTPAAEEPTQEQRAHNQTLKMAKFLALTDAQTAKIEPIILIKNVKIKNISTDASKNKEEKEKELKIIKDAFEKNLMQILTPDQYKKYLFKKEEAKKKKVQTK